MPWGPFLESPGNFSGLGKSFCVSRVGIKDQGFNNFENDTIKLSVTETELTGL